MAKEPDLPLGFEDLRGQVFAGRYEIDELIGTSIRRATFAGKELDADRRVVLVLIRPAALRDQATAKRFEQRVTACGRVRHSAVHNPIDSGELLNGNFYVVSERPAGEPLDRYLGRHPPGRLDWADARPLLLDLVRGLTAAHTRQVVHGAVSPACCWVQRPDFGVPSLRVLDLGVSTNPTIDDADPSHSRTNAMGPDAVFMAPETADDILGDERSDVYLVGLVAWFMLVGRAPFQGDNPFLLKVAHMSMPVPAMQEAGASVPAEVEGMVGQLLAKDPRQRPASMSEVEQAILSLDEDGRAGGVRSEPPQEGGGRRGRARAKQARAAAAHGGGSSREEVAERLETKQGAAAKGSGRRLPGQEIVDARWGTEPRAARVQSPSPIVRPMDSMPADGGAPWSAPREPAPPEPPISVAAEATSVEATARLSVSDMSGLHWNDGQRQDHQRAPDAAVFPQPRPQPHLPTTGPTVSHSPERAEVLSRDLLRALRTEAAAMTPHPAASPPRAPVARTPSDAPMTADSTERVTEEAGALRQAARGASEPTVARTHALSPEDLDAVRRTFEKLRSEPKKG